MTALTITLLLTLTALAGSARSGSSPTPLITTLNGQVERIRNVRAAAWARLCGKTAALGVAFAEFVIAQREYEARLSAHQKDNTR